MPFPFFTRPNLVRRTGLRWAVLIQALWLLPLLLGMKTAFAAGVSCASASMTSPFPFSRVVDSAAQVGRVFYKGYMVVTLANCTNAGSLTDTVSVTIPVDSVGAALPAASGISVLSATPTYTVTPSGVCTFTPSSSIAGYTSIAFRHPVGAPCTYTITFPLSLSMTSSSNIAADNITALSGAVSWWASYSSLGGLSGTLNSSFDLKTTACTLTTNNVTVTLPRVSVNALSGGLGTTAARTPFTLILDGCSSLGCGGNYIARASWTFAPGAGITSIANTASTTPASNVYVQLLDSSFTPISTGESSILAIVSTAGSYQTQHYAQYFAGSGTGGAGKVTGVATLNLVYD